MNANYNQAEILQKTFSEYLKDKRLRRTTERDAIFATVCQTKDSFTPEMIRQHLENRSFLVSRASVYNTIELLLDAKIVVRHQFTSTLVQYELKCLAEQHCHLICTYCDTVRIIKNDKLNRFFSGCKVTKFTTEYYSLYLYGICSKCKFRLARKATKNKQKAK
jgi:Fur family ferric uptake transcriptional regulator